MFITTNLFQKSWCLERVLVQKFETLKKKKQTKHIASQMKWLLGKYYSKQKFLGKSTSIDKA